jgi:hypothetical protein
MGPSWNGKCKNVVNNVFLVLEWGQIGMENVKCAHHVRHLDIYWT